MDGANAPAVEPGGKPGDDLQEPDPHRALAPWERYRALNDAYDLQQKLIDLGDHKARFALVIMTGLNAVAFLLVVRGSAFAELSDPLRPWLGLYIALYGAAAVYFFFQAIESLKPRIYLGAPQPGLPGVRFFQSILGRSEEEYRKAWSGINVDVLGDEIAEQVHILSRINRDKYTALYRLYLGLQILTVLTAGMVGLFEVAAL